MSGDQIGWFQWLTFGLPLALTLEAYLFLVVNLLYLRAPTTELAKAVHLESLQEDRKAHPRGAEIVAMLDYAVCVILWITRKMTSGSFTGWAEYFRGVGNGTVAILCTIVMFLCPAEGAGPKDRAAASTQGPWVIDWAIAQTIMWNILILITGGFALSAGVRASGLDNLIAQASPPWEAFPTA